MWLRRFALLVVLALGASLGEARAADDKVACIEAHTRGQELRLAGQWLAAAKLFRACSSGSCPQPVTQDCTRWYDELRASTPSILVVASEPDGADTVDVKLVIDGAIVADRLPTTPVDIDPGEHTIRLERASGAPVEQRVIARAGEKERRIALRFSRERTTQPARSTSTFGVVMLGVGAAAVATGATFGVLGKVREDELAGSPCGQNGTCAPHDVDVVRQRYWTAGVAGSVGLVALAVGLWYILGR